MDPRALAAVFLLLLAEHSRRWPHDCDCDLCMFIKQFEYVVYRS